MLVYPFANNLSMISVKTLTSDEALKKFNELMEEYSNMEPYKIGGKCKFYKNKGPNIQICEDSKTFLKEGENYLYYLSASGGAKGRYEYTKVSMEINKTANNF